MAIQDSNSERRNLNLMSIFFIIFTWAGGQFKNNQIHLSVVNIEFLHPDRLAIFAWILLFWFAFRYWVTHQGRAKHTILEGLSIYKDQPYLIKIVKNLTGLTHKEEGGFYDASFWIDDNGWFVNYRKIKAITSIKNGIPTGFSPEGSHEKIYLNSIKDLILKIRIIITLSIFKEGVTSYIFPYILFTIATLLGLTRVF